MAKRAIEGRRGPRLSDPVACDAPADLRGVDDDHRRDLISHRVGGRRGDDLDLIPLTAGHSSSGDGGELRLRVAVLAAVAAVLAAVQDRRIHWRDSSAGWS